MTNAGQHGVAGARIEVELDGVDPHAVRLEVRNDGSIPADRLPGLFAPFRGTRERGSGGLGLGVYITREIVRSHGGTVDVASSEATGTRFTIRLPRHAPVAAGEHGA